MNFFQKALCLLYPPYKKRQQMIAWLVLEGWEPKMIYASPDDQYHVIARDGCHIHWDSNRLYDERDINPSSPIVPSGWGGFKNRTLKHFVFIATWAKEKRKP